MTGSVYEQLARGVHRVAGCGITRAELIIAGSQDKPGFVVVLRATPELWAQICLAERFQYPVHVVDAIATLTRPLLPMTSVGELHLTASKPAVLGLNRPEVLSKVGVQLENGMYTVPEADLTASWADVEGGHALAGLWALLLSTYPFFVADNPACTNFLSFVVLPDRRATLADCVRATWAVDPGWNFALALGETGINTAAAQLYRNLQRAGPLGA